MNREKEEQEMPIMSPEEGVVLFYPYIPEAAIAEVENTLRTRWIGQGPKVDKLEGMIRDRFTQGNPAVAVGSGTDALHLAYILAGIEEGDEVITTVFTCTATNIPLLYQKAKIIFADVQRDTLNIDPKHVRELISERTKAIVCVHYGGLPCDMAELREIADEYNIPIIEDAAQALGAKYHGKSVGTISEFTAFSFQAIKQVTAGDGGLLVMQDFELEAKAKRIRWFGIDRNAKQKGIWENDIREVGYKYQMTDIGASIVIASLKEFDNIMEHRQKLFNTYTRELTDIPGLQTLGTNLDDREHAGWIYTVAVEKRWDLQNKLRENRIESAPVHYRNDRYSVFGGRSQELPNMDYLESRYLVLPIHMRVREEDVLKICEVIHSGW